MVITPIAHGSLYSAIKAQVEDETSETVDGPVAEYIARFFTQQTSLPITAQDVQAAVFDDIPTLCAAKPGAETPNFASCAELLQNMRLLTKEEMGVRRLGRTLLQQVAGSELLVSDVYGHPVTLTLDQAAILNIWLTGTGGVRIAKDATLPRTQLMSEDVARPILQQLKTAFEALTHDARLGVVRRYRHGVRLVSGARAPTFLPPPPEPASGPGTERQYETKRWEEIEAILLDLWQYIPKDPDAYTPPLKPKDVLLFRFPSSLTLDLPPNILIWAQVDGDTDGRHPWGDVGLAWRLPIETSAPALLPDPQSAEQAVILGGSYPPEPGDGYLCSHPLAMRGYLCRPVNRDAACPLPDDADPAKITLTTCGTTSTGATLGGPDVCRELPWRDGDFDPEKQCRVHVRCGTVKPCSGPLGSAVTKPKDARGIIDICINNRVEGPVTYLAYHELAHAYQICNKLVGYNPFNTLPTADAKARACCQIEGEGYYAQGSLYEQDGAFFDANGQRGVSASTGIPFNVETFTESWTDFACGPQQGHDGCQKSRNYPPSFHKDLVKWMIEISARNPGRVPVTCSEWLTKGDPRTDLQIRTIERKRLASAPGEELRYANRIGNNMCYVGQVAEEIMELEELGGRVPMTVADDGSPTFPAAAARRGGIVVTTPALRTQTTLPSYTPALLLQEFDAALCKLVGLPTRSPPVRCLVEAERRLDRPLLDYGTTLERFLQQLVAQEELRTGIDELAPAYGRQIGSLFLRQYLTKALPPLAESLTQLSDLLEEIRDISFPGEMCPLNAI